jgi:tRNA nucleotidyltransferase (CCA-adding enzyme)
MGGSGGGGYFSSDPTPIRRALRSAQEQTDTAEFDAECNTALGGMLPKMNNLDREAVNRHLAEIREALEDELDEVIPLRFGGSVAKHTYVDGFSDVDSLVLLDNCKLADRSPAEAREFLAHEVEAAFPEADVSEGTLAVTAKFDDAEIQLLPAVELQRWCNYLRSNGEEMV